jgi:1-aminocyclopropane-1-carboxylate deaminase
MRLAARLEAMITDPVYEGKSMAGLIDLVSRGEIDRSSNVLYAHLGGQPAINAYASLFSLIARAPPLADGGRRDR